MRHRYRVWNILHYVALVSSLQRSVCHLVFSYETSHILLSIAGGKSAHIDVSRTFSVAFDDICTTHSHSSFVVTNRYDPQRYLKNWAKLYHNTQVIFSAHITYMWYQQLLVFLFLGGMGLGPMWPNINLTLSLIVVGEGRTPMPCHFSYYLLQACPHKKCEKKININSNIALSTFTFV